VVPNVIAHCLSLTYGRGVLLEYSDMEIKMDCQSCGACCAWDSSWPEVWSNDDVPEEYLDEDGFTIQCHGNRCSALEGIVGISVRCLIYDRRPIVCRQFEPGSMDCRYVRDNTAGIV
jgi:uncharacterized protein